MITEPGILYNTVHYPLVYLVRVGGDKGAAATLVLHLFGDSLVTIDRGWLLATDQTRDSLAAYYLPQSPHLHATSPASSPLMRLPTRLPISHVTASLDKHLTAR
ncbi:hypothetical protein BD777DRAFT_127382 [Yarrowia lipolytica]|nr:hypothetical protein BD777DRAFT_127382 [Yarrowia lipolytica]